MAAPCLKWIWLPCHSSRDLLQIPDMVAQLGTAVQLEGFRLQPRGYLVGYKTGDIVLSIISFNFLLQSAHLIFTWMKTCLRGPVLDLGGSAAFSVDTQQLWGRARNGVLSALLSLTVHCWDGRICDWASFSITLIVRGQTKRLWKGLASELLIIQGSVLRRRKQASENVIIENPQEPQRPQSSGQLGSFQPRAVAIWQLLQVRIDGEEVPSIISPSLCRDSGIINGVGMPARWKWGPFATNPPPPLASANTGRDPGREWRNEWLSSDITRSK